MAAITLHVEIHGVAVQHTHAGAVSLVRSLLSFAQALSIISSRKAEVPVWFRVSHSRLTCTLMGGGDKRPYNDRALTRAIIPAWTAVIAEKRAIDSICSEYKVSG